MKIQEIRNLTQQELEHKLRSLKEELYKLRFQSKTKCLEKPSQIGQIKKDIARILTVLNEGKNARKAS